MLYRILFCFFFLHSTILNILKTFLITKYLKMLDIKNILTFVPTLSGEHEESSKAQNQVRSKDSSSKKGTMVHKAPICQSPVEFSADAKDKAQGATTWGAGAKTPPPLRRKPHMTTPCESQRIRKTSAPQSEMSSQIGCQRRFLVERVKILIFPEKSDSLTTSSSLGMRLPAFKV